MKKKKRVLVIVVGTVLVVAAVVLAPTMINGNKQNSKEGKMEVVRRGEFVVKVRESGNLQAFLSVEVRSNVEGEIEHVFVQEGDEVHKGQKLLKIDDRQILEQRKQAQANRDARKAQLRQAELRIELTKKQQASGIVQARNAVKVAQSSLTALKATTRQRITEAETRISTTRHALEQDGIARRQSEIALAQAQLGHQRAQARSESAKISLESAQSAFRRNQELFEKDLISRRTFEEAETLHANALSQYETAKKDVETQVQAVESQKQSIEVRARAIESRAATLRLYEQNLTTIRESEAAQNTQLVAELENVETRLKQILETTDHEKELTLHSEVGARAGLLEAESALVAQQERVEWTTVVAPISGTITRLGVEEGEIVTSGRSSFSRGEALMTIADLSKMIVKTRINEVRISKIEVGQEAEIRVESYADLIFKGRVSEISPSAVIPQQGIERAVITFEVDVEIRGPSSELLPGMSADVDIVVFNKDDALQLPIEAVIHPEVLTVKASVHSNELRRLRPEQEVNIRNLVGKEFVGKVGKIRGDRERGNVEILLDGRPHGLRIGPTEVSIILASENSILGVQAQIESVKTYFVHLEKGMGADAKGGNDGQKDKAHRDKGKRVRIEVGQRNNSHFEILSGAVVGDRVFLPSIQQLIQEVGN